MIVLPLYYSDLEGLLMLVSFTTIHVFILGGLEILFISKITGQDHLFLASNLVTENYGIRKQT
jgi:hypothetical protein